MVQLGQVVYSISGRDAGHYFIVVDIDGKFVYICDGKLRTLNKVKRKNARHLNAADEINDILSNRIKAGKATNKEIRSYLSKCYTRQNSLECKGGSST